MKKIAVTFIALLSFVLGAAAFLSVSSGADAHSAGLNIQAGQMDLRITFDGGFSAGNADVKIYKEDGTLYLQGRADKDGRFRFEPEGTAKNWLIVAEHSGHKGQSVYSNESKKSGTGLPAGLPLYLIIGAGLGYLVGLAGIALGYKGLKAERDLRNKQS